MRKLTKRSRAGLLLAGLMLILSAPTARHKPAEAASMDWQGNDAALVIDLVNGLRAEYGLYPYTVNQTLMQAAQAHSDYQAAIGQITHFSTDGSRPRDRVAAAGYAASGSFFVHENIYGGWTGTAVDAVGWWRNSPIHFEGMTSNRYLETGAGVGIAADGSRYYTILFAYRVGQAAPAAPEVSGPVVEVPGGDVSVPAAGAEFDVIPVEVASPGEDGAIWHEVQSGQTFYDIALAYEVDLAGMMALNGMARDSIIYPGNRLLIQPPYTPTPPPPTATPTSTLTPRPGVVPTAEADEAPLMGDAATMAAFAASTQGALRTPSPSATVGAASPEAVEADPTDRVPGRGTVWTAVVAFVGIAGLGILSFGVLRLFGSSKE